MVGLLIYLLYFVTRVINIEQLPIFNDEAFFLWIGKQIRLDPFNNLLLNFSDGKEPLFFWVYSLAPDLLTLRLFSVFWGFMTLTYLRKITNNVWASLFFILSPFLLFYQRLGMQEAMLTFLLTATTYYLINRRFCLAGLLAGLSLLTKTTALAFLIPLFIYRFNLITIVICCLLYLPVFIFGQNVSSHNSSYVGLISQSQIIINFKQAVRWLWDYQGPLGLLGILMPPVIIESFIAKIFFPRYFLFVIPILFILISRLPKFLLVILIIPNLILSYQIITDIRTANLPYIEKWQYIEAWPAGYGIKETANFLKSQKITSVKTENIMVTEYGLQYYYPELLIDDKTGVWVIKKSQELVDERYWEKIYNSYDVSVYRTRTGTQ